MSEDFMSSHTTPGAAPGGQAPVLLQYTIHARVFRLRVLLIFLGVAFLFGLVAWLFFVPTFFEGLIITLGLACFIVAALPRSKLTYVLTADGIECTDTTGDRFDLHSVVPLFGAIALFGVLVFSLPTAFFLYIGAGCGIILLGVRWLLPRQKSLETWHLPWRNVRRIMVEHRRQALLLAEFTDTFSPNDVMVFCPKHDFAATLERVRGLAPEAEVVKAPIVY